VPMRLFSDGILAHRAILHARCPALRGRLARAGAAARASERDGLGGGGKAAVALGGVFKGDASVDGEERVGARLVRRWPSAMRSFVCYLYTGQTCVLTLD
jgi:hypothetical protein